MVANPLQTFLALASLKNKDKYNHTTVAIILYATKPANHNHSNFTQRIKSIKKNRSKDLRWVQITTNTSIKFKFETSVKERYQQLLDFITIDIINLEQQYYSNKKIITLPMNQITNSYSSKHPMSWEFIHRNLV